MSKVDRELLASFKGSYQSDIRWIKAGNKALKALSGSPRQREQKAIMRTIEREYIMKHWTVDYTCHCGLYVHPDNPLTKPDAIHISDCHFAP